MTITKRKRKYQETEEDNVEIEFNWSNPIIVKAEKFKTDDFYHYVFCDPDPNYIISTNELKTNNFDFQVSKCIEITDEIAMELDKDNNKSETGNEMDLPDHLKSVHKYPNICDDEKLIKMSIHGNIHEITDKITKSLKDDTIEINFAKNAKADDAEMDVNKNSYQADEIAANPKQDKDMTNKIYKTRDKINVVERYPETGCTNNQKLNIFANPKEMGGNNFIEKVPLQYGPNIFPFSNPIILETDIQNIKQDTIKAYNFSSPEFENSKNEVIDITSILEKNINKDIMGPVNKTTDLNWIFDKTTTKTNIEEMMKKTAESSKILEEDCKFCWIFTKQNKCEYCKKPINVVIDKKSENNTTIDTMGLENPIEIKENIKQDILKAWQCNVCLTENNKDRFTCCCCESKKYIENGDCRITFGHNNTFFEITKKQDISENNVSTAKTAEPFIIIEETAMMDMKCDTIELKDKERNTIQSMEIETDSVNYNFNTKMTEQMDIEEYVPITNLVPTFAPTQTLGANIGPFIGTNVQFNIGSQRVQNDKGGRRIKRAVRNIPKAFHK